MSTPGGETLGEANIQVDADTDPAMRALREFSRDAQGRIRDVRGRFVRETDEITRALNRVSDEQITVEVDTDPAQEAVQQFTRDAAGRLRSLDGRFVATGNTISRSLRQASDGGDRFSFSLRRLGQVAGVVGGVLGKFGLVAGAVGAAAGTAVPLLASVVTALENIAPAGAVAATGMLAIEQASIAVKLGMVGIEDAVTAALDPTKAKDFDKAIKNLAPNAREFARELKSLAPELQKFQRGVQNRIFKDFGVALDVLSKTVLPTVRTNLNRTADTLNRMALGAAGAAIQLAENGTLGQALAGANTGLTNLTRIPAQVVTALGQLAVAGAPAFDQLTSAAADVATRVSTKLGDAFKSGALQDSVDTAIGLLKSLGEIAGNVFGTVKNVLGSVSGEGGGAFTVLTQVTQALQDATATQGFQEAMQALAQTMGVVGQVLGGTVGTLLADLGPVFTQLAGPVQSLVKTLGTALKPVLGALADTFTVLGTTLGPILESALTSLSPVLVALAGPLQVLISSLGAGLSPIIDALGPVLLSAASAIGNLVVALSPLLPVVGNLISALLPPLIPIIDTLGQTFTDLAPFVLQVGEILTAVLAPIIGALPAIITPLLDTFSMLTATLLPVLSDLLIQLAPTFTQLAGTVAELIVAAAPLLQVLGPLLVDVIAALLPVITPVIGLLTNLVSVLVDNLAGAITNVIVPAIDVIVALFSGDLSGAVTALGDLFTGVWEQIKTVVSNVGGFISDAIDTIIGIFQYLYDTLVGGSIIPDLVNAIIGLFTSLGAFFTRIMGAIRTTIVGAITAASGIVSAQVNAIRGFFTSGFNAVKRIVSDAISNVVKTVRGLKDRVQGAVAGARTWLVNAGKDAIRGLISGMGKMLDQVRAKAAQIADTVAGAVANALKIGSPSKVMERLGRFIGDGLVKGLTGSEAKIRSSAKRLAELLRDVVEVKGISRRENSLLRRVAADSKQLRQLASDRDKIGDRLKAANAKLTAIESKYAQVRSSIANQILASGEIVQRDVRQPTATGILASLQASVKAAQDFQRVLATLKSKGLRGDLLEQLASAGVEAGAATAAALNAATPQQIDAINSAQSDLVKASKKTGTTVADALYGAGVKAAQGLVDGLKSQEAAIQKQMDKIAKQMVEAIKKALKIKSPSRVAQGLGDQFGAGLVRGLDQSLTPVRSATSRLSDAVGAMRTTGRNAPLTLSPAAATAMVAANRLTATVAAPNVTVMIGNRAIKDYVQVVVDKTNADVARQQVQGVRR